MNLLTAIRTPISEREEGRCKQHTEDKPTPNINLNRYFHIIVNCLADIRYDK